MDKTIVKFLGEMTVEIQDKEISNDERVIALSTWECQKCLWGFFGDCERHGFGYNSEGTQVPNFCPMCGAKIESCID